VRKSKTGGKKQGKCHQSVNRSPEEKSKDTGKTKNQVDPLGHFHSREKKKGDQEGGKKKIAVEQAPSGSLGGEKG